MLVIARTSASRSCRKITYRSIVSPGMQYRIIFKRYHARSVRPDTSRRIFTFRKVALSFSPSVLISPVKVTLSRTRGAPRHAVTVADVVVVAVAGGVHIPEVVGVVGIRGAQPPVGYSTSANIQGATYDFLRQICVSRFVGFYYRFNQLDFIVNERR